MDRLEAHGVSVAVPVGWEAQLCVQEDAAATDVSAEAPQPRIVLHAANFALPPNRDDYGTEAVQAMDRGGIFMALIEFDEASARSRLFAAEGVPVLSHADFAVDQVLRPLRGQSGSQRFFRVADRAFCLYAVIGSHSLRGLLVGEANRILSGLAVV